MLSILKEAGGVQVTLIKRTDKQAGRQANTTHPQRLPQIISNESQLQRQDGRLTPTWNLMGPHTEMEILWVTI